MSVKGDVLPENIRLYRASRPIVKGYVRAVSTDWLKALFLKNLPVLTVHSDISVTILPSSRLKNVRLVRISH